MLEWLDKVGYGADLPRLRRSYPEIGWLTFGDWAKQESLAPAPVANA
jgi:hypothetical protein